MSFREMPCHTLSVLPEMMSKGSNRIDRSEMGRVANQSWSKALYKIVQKITANANYRLAA
jgi:hypothetical protein